MKRQILYLIAIFFIFQISCSRKHHSHVTFETIKCAAPFEMPAITIPNFTNCRKYTITEFGAVPENKQKTSMAIAKAIDIANKNGGGTVVIPKGEWLTEKVHLKSNVNLHLEMGAILLFSDNPEDYLPPVYSTWEGMECLNYSPLIYAWQCKNIAITGQGELKAKMDIWKAWFARSQAHLNSLKRLYILASVNVPIEDRLMVNDSAHFRPQFIQFNRCENVLLEGISILNSPFWTIHPYQSKNVVIRNVHVFAHGHNNDGVDPEMSQNVLIENCAFDQGDDAIAIKSGRNQDAWRLNTPSKNIIIRNVTVKNGHQLVAIGSELSGGVENVFVDSCKVVNGAKLNHLLFIKTNERRGGFVRNIYVQNTFASSIAQGILGIETDVLYQWRDLVPTTERRLTPIKDIYLNNVFAEKVHFISRILGPKELPVKNVVLKNVHADTIMGQNYISESVLDFKVE